MTDKKKVVSRNFKIRNSWGVYDAYKWIRKHGWSYIEKPLAEHDFYVIIRSINDLLAKRLGLGEPVNFPFKMGCLELRKYECGAQLFNGKLKVTYPIDWKKTLSLWHSEKSALKDKLLVRKEQKWIYHIKYCKQRANYENKVFYQFCLNRKIKQALKDNIETGKIDTLW